MSKVSNLKKLLEVNLPPLIHEGVSVTQTTPKDEGQRIENVTVGNTGEDLKNELNNIFRFRSKSLGHKDNVVPKNKLKVEKTKVMKFVNKFDNNQISMNNNNDNQFQNQVNNSNHPNVYKFGVDIMNYNRGENTHIVIEENQEKNGDVSDNENSNDSVDKDKKKVKKEKNLKKIKIKKKMKKRKKD